MFLPISRSIYCGALSPSVLEARHCTDECLRRDVQRLLFLPATLPRLTELLSDVLRHYDVELPSFPTIAPLPLNTCCPSAFYSSLCTMREDELDSMIRLAPEMEVFTLRYSLYEALLRAEMRWLKLNIEKQIRMLRSDNEARILLLRVLEEIYVFISQMGSGLSNLKVALGELYLELTILFGFLMRSTDYLDYHRLQQDLGLGRRTLPYEECKYAILVDESQVKAIVSRQEVGFLENGISNLCKPSAEAANNKNQEERAIELYNELVTLIATLPTNQPLHSRLTRGITALENHLFFLYSGLPLEQGDLYHLFTDGHWIASRFFEIRKTYYSEDYGYGAARDAYHWIDCKLYEPCFAFLSSLISLQDSLPRRLQAYLMKQRQLYQDNLGSILPTAGKEGDLSVVLSQSDLTVAVDEAEVHRMLAFLYNDSSSWLSFPNQAGSLESYFCQFLHTGTPCYVPHALKIKIRPRCSERLYGLFLHHCTERKGNPIVYAKFMIEVFATEVTLDTFHKNASRYIKKYTAFCSKSEKNSSGLL